MAENMTGLVGMRAHNQTVAQCQSACLACVLGPGKYFGSMENFLAWFLAK